MTHAWNLIPLGHDQHAAWRCGDCGTIADFPVGGGEPPREGCAPGGLFWYPEFGQYVPPPPPTRRERIAAWWLDVRIWVCIHVLRVERID